MDLSALGVPQERFVNPLSRTMVRSHASETVANRGSSSSPAPMCAELSYLVHNGSKPVHYAYTPPDGVPWESVEYEARRVDIRDARTMRHQPSIQREGFELWDAPTALADYHDADHVRATYYPELEALALLATGGQRAYVFDHLVRQCNPALGKLDFGRSTKGQPAAPNARIHTDYTERSGLRRLGLVVPDAHVWPTPRYCIINIWRSLRGPVWDTPLALCDARSVDCGDLIEAEVRYPRRNGEIYVVRYAQRHHWWYYSGMDRHEALVFKQYDSRINGVARFVPHAAFAHPQPPADALPRISIEARCLVIFD